MLLARGPAGPATCAATMQQPEPEPISVSGESALHGPCTDLLKKSRPCTVQSWLKALKNKNILLAPDVVHQHFYGAGRDRWILQWHHETHSPVVDHTVFKITDTSHARWLYCDVSKTNPQSIVRAREDITEFVSVDADEPLNFFQLGYVGRDRGPECNLALILCAFGADRGLLPDQAQPALGAGADLTAADRSGSPSPNETLHVDEDH